MIEDFLLPHDKHDIKKLDLLKINAIEILMNISQFAPPGSIRMFMLCEDQRTKGYPFIKRLAAHMIYSFEQGIKIQIFEFFKVLLDNEQGEKKVEFNDLFYKDVLTWYLGFLNTVEDLPPPEDQPASASQQLPEIDKKQDYVSHHSYRHIQDYNRSLEYSRSLVVQLLTKCA